jgi:hypothetical protein
MEEKTKYNVLVRGSNKKVTYMYIASNTVQYFIYRGMSKTDISAK